MFALEDNNSPRRRPLRVAVAVLSAMALAGVSALALQHQAGSKPDLLVPQATTTVTCGQLITVSIVVANDLPCGSGNGLNVGHAAITINLNGHTLTGNSASRGIDAHAFPAVTITNGTVSGWGFGVQANGPANKVTAIRATRSNTAGITVDGEGASATGNVVFNNSFGIIADGLNVKVTSNVARENVEGLQVNGTGDVIQANQVEDSSDKGIANAGSGATVTGNIVNASANDGINSTLDRTANIASNTANYNGAFGIEASAEGKDGGGNRAKGNGQAAQCKDVICS